MPSTHRQKGFLLFIVDFCAFSFAWWLYYVVRIESGVFGATLRPDFLVPMVVISLYWHLLYWIFGLYRPESLRSRVDELILLFKTTSFGVFLLFFVIFIDDAGEADPLASRLKIVLYWAIILAVSGIARMAIRSIRKRMLIAGIGHTNTLIIGPVERIHPLAQHLREFPALGYKVIGYLSSDAPPDSNGETTPRLGSIDDLESVIPKYNIHDVVITVDSTQHELLLDIIGRCSAFRVGIKIRPDLYDVVSGQAKTNQILGIPLIEVTPQLMPGWEMFMKRVIDVGASACVLLLGAPALLLISIIQKFASKGPILYTQLRVGRDGKVFTILKFRTMYTDAEQTSGPQWAQKNDPRVTPFGRILRKFHLDELPQVLNVLRGDMSLVGPRPERPFFVNRLVREIPLYRRRLNVRPGMTGWAQVKHRYDRNIDDVRTKLSYDIFYIENMSIRLDLKIILNTISIVFAGKGHA